jgi:hypothetical protein
LAERGEQLVDVSDLERVINHRDPVGRGHDIKNSRNASPRDRISKGTDANEEFASGLRVSRTQDNCGIGEWGYV